MANSASTGASGQTPNNSRPPVQAAGVGVDPLTAGMAVGGAYVLDRKFNSGRGTKLVKSQVRSGVGRVRAGLPSTANPTGGPTYNFVRNGLRNIGDTTVQTTQRAAGGVTRAAGALSSRLPNPASVVIQRGTTAAAPTATGRPAYSSLPQGTQVRISDLQARWQATSNLPSDSARGLAGDAAARVRATAATAERQAIANEAERLGLQVRNGRPIFPRTAVPAGTQTRITDLQARWQATSNLQADTARGLAGDQAARARAQAATAERQNILREADNLGLQIRNGRPVFPRLAGAATDTATATAERLGLRTALTAVGQNAAVRGGLSTLGALTRITGGGPFALATTIATTVAGDQEQNQVVNLPNMKIVKYPGGGQTVFTSRSELSAADLAGYHVAQRNSDGSVLYRSADGKNQIVAGTDPVDNHLVASDDHNGLMLYRNTDGTYRLFNASDGKTTSMSAQAGAEMASEINVPLTPRTHFTDGSNLWLGAEGGAPPGVNGVVGATKISPTGAKTYYMNDGRVYSQAPGGTPYLANRNGFNNTNGFTVGSPAGAHDLPLGRTQTQISARQKVTYLANNVSPDEAATQALRLSETSLTRPTGWRTHSMTDVVPDGDTRHNGTGIIRYNDGTATVWQDHRIVGYVHGSAANGGGAGGAGASAEPVPVGINTVRNPIDRRFPTHTVGDQVSQSSVNYGGTPDVMRHVFSDGTVTYVKDGHVIGREVPAGTEVGGTRTVTPIGSSQAWTPTPQAAPQAMPQPTTPQYTSGHKVVSSFAGADGRAHFDVTSTGAVIETAGSGSSQRVGWVNPATAGSINSADDLKGNVHPGSTSPFSNAAAMPPPSSPIGNTTPSYTPTAPTLPTQPVGNSTWNALPSPSTPSSALSDYSGLVSLTPSSNPGPSQN